MTTIAMDPRIRARRVAVLRAQGRRRLHVIALVASLLLLVATAWTVSRTELLDVDRISVAGTGSARSTEVLFHAGLDVDRPMLFLDVDSAERAITALPWVRSANVWRDWPATVRIAVEPRVPAAVVPAGAGRAAIVDIDGHVIDWSSSASAPNDPIPVTPAEQDLAVVSVPFVGELGEVHTAALPVMPVLDAMPDDLRLWAQTLDVDADTGHVIIELTGGATVAFGEPVLIDDKVAAIRAVLAGTALECLTVIDVSMPDLPTVTRHPSCRL